MSKEKHTPLKAGTAYKNVVFDSKGNIAATCNSIQIAELMIHACNNHDRLVEALEKLQHAVIEYPFADNRTQKACIESKKLLTELKQQ